MYCIASQWRGRHRILTDQGVDVVLTHHSHVFQPVLKQGKSVVALSLGDFIFDLFWDTRLYRSAILNILFSYSDNDVSYEIHPIEFRKSYKAELLNEIKKKKYLSSLELLTEYEQKKFKNEYANRAQMERLNNIKLQYKKMAFFAMNFMKGNTLLKTKFVLSKLEKLFR